MLCCCDGGAGVFRGRHSMCVCDSVYSVAVCCRAGLTGAVCWSAGSAVLQSDVILTLKPSASRRRRRGCLCLCVFVCVCARVCVCVCIKTFFLNMCLNNMKR